MKYSAYNNFVRIYKNKWNELVLSGMSTDKADVIAHEYAHETLAHPPPNLSDI